MPKKNILREIIDDIKLKRKLKQYEIAKIIDIDPDYFSRKIRLNDTITLKKVLFHFPEYAEQEKTKKIDLGQPDNRDRVLLKVLIQDYLKLKSLITKKTYAELADELDLNTTIAMRELK